MIFESTDEYISTDELSMAVDAAVKLERPLLIKGEPGTGKTMLAEQVAASLDMELIEWHIKSSTKAVNGLYEYDAVSRLRDSQLGDERVADIKNYIKERQTMGGLLNRMSALSCSSMKSIRPISSFRTTCCKNSIAWSSLFTNWAQRSKRIKRPIVIITSNRRERTARRFFTPLFLPLH